MPKKALISEEDAQFPKEVIVKGIDKAFMCVLGLLDNMVDHVVHHMQFDLEVSKIEDVECHPEFQPKIMNDDIDIKEDIS